MANPEHVQILKQGVKVWEEWRKEHPKSPDLSAAYLEGADLRGATLGAVTVSIGDPYDDETYIEPVNLQRVNLRNADLRGAALNGADLQGAILSWADLRFANLRNANLNAADLHGATLCHNDLTETIFAQAVMAATIFADVDLSMARGLESVIHKGPSTIGIDTIQRSNGRIPEMFLRRAGAPDTLIAYATSLVAQPFQFYSCFISYSSDDQAFAERLYTDLCARNLHCWFAPEDLKIGDRFQERIEESIRIFDKVMIVLSKASVQSRWVEREVNAAREREDRENRTVLFPIRIDEAVMSAPQPWAADIRRSRHIGDFRAWEVQSSYQKAFERLLRDLKAEPDAEGEKTKAALSDGVGSSN